MAYVPLGECDYARYGNLGQVYHYDFVIPAEARNKGLYWVVYHTGSGTSQIDRYYLSDDTRNIINDGSADSYNVGRQGTYSLYTKYGDGWRLDSTETYQYTYPSTRDSLIAFIYPNAPVSNGKSDYFRTNIPVFESTDASGVNSYIQSGDTSSAINQDDINPLKIDYEVWLDGAEMPNIYVRANSASERTVENSIMLCTEGIGSVTIVNDTLNYWTYGQITGGSDSTRTIYFYPENLYTDNVVYFSLSKNGVVNGSVNSPSANGHCTLTIYNTPPNEDDYPNNTETSDDTNSDNPFNGLNLLTTTYRLNTSQLTGLGNFLWSNTFKENVLDLAGHPLENIVSIKAMPYVDDSSNSTEIKVGNVNTGINGSKLDNDTTFKQTIGTISIPRKFNNFLDYTARIINIFLPFIGFKELDAKVVVGKSVRIEYIFDVLYGTCCAVIKVNDNGIYNTIACYEGSCGIDVPLTSTNRADIENGYISGALGAITNAINGNVGGILNDGIGAFTQDFHSESTGVGNPSLMNKLTRKCFLVFKEPKQFSPDGYGESFGHVCYLRKKLSSLSGYTIVKNFKCKNVNLLENEKEELKQLMEGGVYL